MSIIDHNSAFLQALNIANLTSSELALVDGLIEVAEYYLQNTFWNRQIAAANYVDEKLDGTGEASIFVKNPPINSLTDIDIVSISEDGEQLIETYDNSNFTFKAKTGEIQFNNGRFPEGFQNVYVTYNGGFTVIPPVIKMLIADFVLYSYDPSLLDQLVEKEKLGEYFYAKSIGLLQSFPVSKKKIFDAYRIRRVPTL